MKEKPTRQQALAEFEAAPDDTLFSQVYIAYYLDCSEAKMERDRWAGTGIKYFKIGRLAKYQKRDAVKHRKQFQPQQSTSDSKNVAT